MVLIQIIGMVNGPIFQFDPTFPSIKTEFHPSAQNP